MTIFPVCALSILLSAFAHVVDSRERPPPSSTYLNFNRPSSSSLSMKSFWILVAGDTLSLLCIPIATQGLLMATVTWCLDVYLPDFLGCPHFKRWDFASSMVSNQESS